MTELTQGLGLDLTDALSGDIKLLAHFLQSAGASVLNAKAQLQDLFLPGGEGTQHIHQLLLQQGEAGGLGGLGRALIRDEVAQVGVLLLADGGLQGYRLLSDFQNLPDLIHGHIHLGGDLLRGGIVPQLLQKLTGNADDLIDGLHHMHGDADGAGLVSDGAGDGLADPPGGIGGELITLGVVELLHSLDKAQVALLDQIQKQHSATGITLGNGHHQTQVSLSQLLLGAFTGLHGFAQLFQILLGEIGHFLFGNLNFTHGILGIQHRLHSLAIGLFPGNECGLGLVPGGNSGGQFYLALCGKQRDLANLLEVHADGVIDIEAVYQSIGIYQLLLLNLGDFLQRRVDFGVDIRQEGFGGNLDGKFFQRIIDHIQLLALQIHAVKHIGEFAALQLAVALTLDEKLLQTLVALNQLSGRQGSDGLVVQLSLVALDDFLFNFTLLLVGLLQESVGHFLQLFFGVFCLCHRFFPPYPFLNLYFSCAASSGSSSSPPICRSASSRMMRM